MKINYHSQNNYHYIFFIFFILSIIILTFFKNDMHNDTKGNLHHINSESATIAISSLEYNLDGYVGYELIKNLFMNNKNLDNTILLESIKYNKSYIEKTDIFLVNDFELGYIDFYKIAFYLFDYKISSLLYMYLLIFIFPIIIFIFEFKKNQIALSLLPIFLTAYYFIINTAINTPSEFGVMYNNRLMTILGIIPLFHITLISILNKKINIISFLFILIQSVILAWLYNIRVTSQWMFIFLIFVIIYNFYKSLDTQSKKIQIVSFLLLNLKKTIPILLVFILTVFITFYYQNNRSYLYDERLAKHPFWHSILLGMTAYDDEIYKMSTKQNRKINPWHEVDYFCDNNNFIGQNKIKLEIKNFICKKKYIANSFLNIRLLFSKKANDQDAYTSAFQKLYNDGKDEYSIFKFKKNEFVDYYNEFWIFKIDKNSSQINIDKVNFYNENKAKFRKFNWNEDLNWTKYESILKDITIENIINYPFKIIKLLIITKPIMLIKIFIINYSGNIFSLILLCTTSVFIFLFDKKNLSEKKVYIQILFFMLLTSLIAPIITYPGIETICDPALIFWIFFIFNFNIIIKKFNR